MRIYYEIRQQVRVGDKTRLEVIHTTEFERAAFMSYDNYRENYPDEYFELCLIRHEETCLKFTAKIGLKS